MNLIGSKLYNRQTFYTFKISMSSFSDGYIIKEIANGNIKAFDILYKKYSSPILNYIYKLIRDSSLAEDIFQDTFIRVIQNIDKYNPVYKFSTWIYTIASNLCFNELKKINKNMTLFYATELNSDDKSKKRQMQVSSKEKSPLENVELADIHAKIKFALNSLSENHRMVFIQKFYQDLSYKEIADIMNCSIGTVKSA